MNPQAVESYENVVVAIVDRYQLTDQEMIAIITQSLSRVLKEIAQEDGGK